MPGRCHRTNSGEYAVRHNPPPYYTELRGCSRFDVPYSRLRADLARGRLPAFSFITPNLISDMHDGTVADGDTWLSTFMPKVLSSAEYAAGRTAVFLTWDEDDLLSGNHVPTLVIAPSVAAGTTVAARLDHYAMLRATQEMLGVTPLLGAAATAADMRTPFNL